LGEEGGREGNRGRKEEEKKGQSKPAIISKLCQIPICGFFGRTTIGTEFSLIQYINTVHKFP